jgi:hypothetical protein
MDARKLTKPYYFSNTFFQRSVVCATGPEEKPYCLQSEGTHLSLAEAGVFAYFPEEILSGPRCALRKAGQGGYGKPYPAENCGAICLSFRALPGFPQNFDQRNGR